MMTDQMNITLRKIGVKARAIDYKHNGNYFHYDLSLLDGGKVSHVTRHLSEIALGIKSSIPTAKLVEELGCIRLTFTSPIRSSISLLDSLSNNNLPNAQIPCMLGSKSDGSSQWFLLDKAPHTLIAGETGSGKSVLLHNIIANILNYSDSQLFIVDPKQIEFGAYAKVGAHVYRSYNSTVNLINSLVDSMEQRYSYISAGGNVDSLRNVVCMIDEFAYLKQQDSSGELVDSILKLAQKSRAAKIHLVVATQRPSVDVINGVIKANFPARISCRVSSKVDSKVILDDYGAESLVGAGDAILRDSNNNMTRFQIAYTSSDEVIKTFGM